MEFNNHKVNVPFDEWMVHMVFNIETNTEIDIETQAQLTLLKADF